MGSGSDASRSEGRGLRTVLLAADLLGLGGRVTLVVVEVEGWEGGSHVVLAWGLLDETWELFDSGGLEMLTEVWVRGLKKFETGWVVARLAGFTDLEFFREDF